MISVKRTHKLTHQVIKYFGFILHRYMLQPSSHYYIIFHGQNSSLILKTTSLQKRSKEICPATQNLGLKKKTVSFNV